MRIFLWFFGLFASAVGLAVLVRYNVSNVVIFFPPYRIDFSLNFFLLILFLFLFVMYLIIRAVDTARRLPAQVTEYRRKKRENEGNRALREAIKALFEGRFVQAEKSAVIAQELPENAGNAALIGARAAHSLSQTARRDAFLASLEKDESFRTARLMTSLEFLVRDHQTRGALEVLNELNASGTRHVQAQRWALKAQQQAKNWDEVLKLVQSLDKHHAIKPVLADRLRELAYADLFVSGSHDAERVRRLWQKVPEADRVRPYIAVRAAKAFTAAGLGDEARDLLATAIQSDFDDRLIHAYREAAAETGTEALLKQIENCETWMQAHPSDPELILTLGALCFKEKLWGKAQNNLDRVIYNQEDRAIAREAHLLLAQLHETLGHAEEAAKHYKASALAA
ncbi:heme biosynthesis protein HemY [Oxalobacter vibrioformis]|uniref:Heme biosynthesis protein HemY n=1 Tax=Oxalobacter vibrioformis TaxID=933080 RepID=A0A9E9P2S9_9BURK|nr:heme biosynthesis HemY N-terminal domain-containing protein [Oxalobacter vibrioformis]WAW09540.1 heme biosynthesis protein HemY [Oxalobacter vibrioformis]